MGRRCYSSEMASRGQWCRSTHRADSARPLTPRVPGGIRGRVRCMRQPSGTAQRNVALDRVGITVGTSIVPFFLVSSRGLACRRRSSMPRSLLALLVLSAPVAAQNSTPRSPFDSYITSPEVIVDPKDGSLRLAHSVLVTDETGATDWLQTETLSEQVRAKKMFQLDSADVTRAELFIYGSPKNVIVNGETVPNERLVSTGWTRAAVPVKLLRVGDNEVTFSGGGNLLVEPSKRPAR